MSAMTRDELVKELRELHWTGGDNDYGAWDNSEEIADFILKREAHIVEPLVKGYLRPDFPRMSMNGQLNSLYEATVETLHRAGHGGGE